MSEAERGARRTGVLTVMETAPAESGGASDSWEIELGAYEAVEFKYTIDKGNAMGFTWRSSAPLHYDMHAHPFDGGEELTESYDIGEVAVMRGRYVAPFSGIHGWYWQNRNLKPVRLRLDATGGMSSSKIFGAAGERERPLASSSGS